MPDTSQNNRLEKREALDLALFHKLTRLSQLGAKMSYFSGKIGCRGA
jgi:hypothetical protein